MSTALALIPRESFLVVPQNADLIEAFLAGRTATTIKAYKFDMEDFAKFLGAESPGAGIEQLIAGDGGLANRIVLAYRSDMLGRNLSASSVNRRLSALRSMVKLARMIGRVVWTLDVENVKAESRKDNRGPGTDGWRKMVAISKAEAESGSLKTVRDYAILRILHDMAMRRGELAGLDLEDVDFDECSLAIVGKGKREKVRLTMPTPTVLALRAWVALRGSEGGALFTSLDFASKGGRLTGDSICRMVTALGERAGLLRAVRAHGLRHEAITAALDAGQDVRQVRKFSRHAKLETVLLYDDARHDTAGEIADLISRD
jgi:integrase/recombinase XerC